MSTLKKKEPLLSSTNQWWKSLVDECPITLEPLSSLPYPPFVLRSGEKVSYFDGLALASYVVSRGIFHNPLTRQELTRADCRRLDGYLEEYCYNREHQQLNYSSRRISVSEALGLHAAVHVISGGQTDRRADALRHTATAALAGLFVYGNDRQQRHQGDNHTPQHATRVLQPHSPQSLLEWGFDLSRTVEDTAQFASEGWTVIDDDEAMVVATDRQHYQATQDAFPRLSSTQSETAPSSTTGISSDTGTSSTLSPDLHLVESVHAIAEQERLQQVERERHLELTRQQMLHQALQRREERRQERELLRSLAETQLLDKQEQDEETRRARQEIEAWREEQWEKLRLFSEQKMQTEKKRQEKEKDTKEAKEMENEAHGVDNTATQVTDGPSEEEMAVAKNKANKVVEKKRRQKERKKGQKQEERALLEKKKREQELAAQKAAASIQCAACGGGVLDCGFEKFQQKFCCPKCARTAKPVLRLSEQ
jgi:hypothetical protein